MTGIKNQYLEKFKSVPFEKCEVISNPMGSNEEKILDKKEEENQMSLKSNEVHKEVKKLYGEGNLDGAKAVLVQALVTNYRSKRLQKWAGVLGVEVPAAPVTDTTTEAPQA